MLERDEPNAVELSLERPFRTGEPLLGQRRRHGLDPVSGNSGGSIIGRWLRSSPSCRSSERRRPAAFFSGAIIMHNSYDELDLLDQAQAEAEEIAGDDGVRQRSSIAASSCSCR